MKRQRLGRVVRAPFTALRFLRDFYVRSITSCAANGRVGVVAGSAGLPRSYSLNPSRVSSSSETDLRELVRAASQGAMGSLNRGVGFGPVVPRSQSVAVGRIDEDKPCDFSGEVGLGPLVFPRSRSCAVPVRKRGFAA
ncbi:uncharacterized protein LOC144702368 [Wolffia australiana]